MIAMEYLQKLKKLFYRGKKKSLNLKEETKSKYLKEEKIKDFNKYKEKAKESYKTNNFQKEGGKYNMAVKESYALVLGFKNSKEKTCTITIDNVKDNLTQENITPVMDAMLAENIITTSTGDDLVSKVFAKVVAKTETDYQYE